MWQALYMARDNMSLGGSHVVHPWDSLLRV